MKYIIWLVGCLAIPLSASAEIYKCTDADGNINFTDKPCPKQQQEILKEQTTSTPSEIKPDFEGDEFPQIEPIQALAGGKKVNSNSPLAKVYMNFLNAIKRCDRNEMMKHVSSKMAKAMDSTSDEEFREGCRTLQLFLPQDFKDAREVIDGDRGKIQWLTVETSGDMTMRHEQTEDFIKENGVWKYGD